MVDREVTGIWKPAVEFRQSCNLNSQLDSSILWCFAIYCDDALDDRCEPCIDRINLGAQLVHRSAHFLTVSSGLGLVDSRQ